MTPTLVRGTDGLLALLQAVPDRVEDLLALGGEGADLALASRPGGGDLAVEAVEVELERLELERRGRGAELPGTEDDLGDELRELGRVADHGGRVVEMAAQAFGGQAGEWRCEEGVALGGCQLLLAELRKRDAEREEGALGLLAAIEGLAGAVPGAGGEPARRALGEGGRGRAGVAGAGGGEKGPAPPAQPAFARPPGGSPAARRQP